LDCRDCAHCQATRDNGFDKRIILGVIIDLFDIKSAAVKFDRRAPADDPAPARRK